MNREGGAERRRYERLDVRVLAWYGPEEGPQMDLESPIEVLGALSADLSAGGVKIIVDESARPEEMERVDLKIPGMRGTIETRTHPAWTRKRRDGRVEVGLEFVDMDGESRDRIARYVAERSACGEDRG